MTPQDVIDCWKQVFPNSAVYARIQMGTTITVRGYIASDASECVNRIIDNDPLMYVGFIKDGEWSEMHAYMYVKPTEPNRVFSSETLRKKTIKDITPEKLTKRFREVRKFIMDNSDKLKDPLFDITTK